MSSEPADKKARMPVTLGYWKIRGLGQPIRLLLKYTGTEFEDVRYTQGEAPDYSREEWLSVKETLGLDFPNLPYFMDGEVKITQSNAIMAHIARKHNLAGKDDVERATVDMLACVAMDFRNGFVGLAYNSAMASMREKYLNKVKVTLKRLSDYLGEEKPWFAGNEITYPDFFFYELLDEHRLFEPHILDEYDNLKRFLDRFEALHAIKEYMSSGDFLAWPVNNNTAAWGSGSRE